MNELDVFKGIKNFIFDVDGVFTNSELIILEDGSLLRKMNTRDGYAVKLASNSGYHVCIITGGTSEGVVKRLQGLGVKDVYKGIHNKLDKYQEHMFAYDLNPEETLYMGDDLPDYEVMRKVGLPVCPSDAAPEIKALSRYISPIKGGQGCVRDVIEKVLKLDGNWQQMGMMD